MATPTAADFEVLSRQMTPAQLRARYLDELDRGLRWDQMLYAPHLVSHKKAIVQKLFVELKLNDSQIAFLLETTEGRVFSFRTSHGVRRYTMPAGGLGRRSGPHGPKRQAREDEDVVDFCNRWDLIFSPAFDPQDPDRPFFRCPSEIQTEIAIAADELAEYHNARI